MVRLRRSISFFFPLIPTLWEVQQVAKWVIATHRAPNFNCQEGPRVRWINKRTIFHADEYAFVAARAYFPISPPGVRLIHSSSIVSFVQNVLLTLLWQVLIFKTTSEAAQTNIKCRLQRLLIREHFCLLVVGLRWGWNWTVFHNSQPLT